MGEGERCAERYFAENGKIYCNDGVNKPYMVTCTVEAFLAILKMEGYDYEA